MSEPTDESPRTSPESATDDNPGQPPRKRQRVRLSCLECRRRKLSCDRGLPCERCLKSGTPDRCNYETRPGLAPPKPGGLNLSLPLTTGISESLLRKDASREYDRIKRLELEVTQLKHLLTRAVGSDGSRTLMDDSPMGEALDDRDSVAEQDLPPFLQYHDATTNKDELRFFRGKEFRTRYFGPHNACMAFSELAGLSPFMKETAEEWLKPMHIAHDTKDRSKRKELREKQYLAPDLHLEALLPPQEQTDQLIAVYLDQFEQLHRIVHIPSFRRQYATFWTPGETRPAAFTALVLSMMAISACMHRSDSPSKFVGMVSCSHQQAEKWVNSCEDWHRRQSHKHRRLIHYQVACLLYLGKRVNTMKKKRFWTSAGALAREGIALGLHRDPRPMADKISPFNQEMRRRLWATIQEFDFQASVDHGLPTVISTLHFDVSPPNNLNDEDFDEDSTELPASKPITEYTMSSYQHLSRQSLALRLELSRLLTGPPGQLDYDQVIRYTNDISQAIDSLPSWDTSPRPETEEDPSNLVGDAGTAKKPLLAYTLLHIQIRQYIIQLHQPYLRMRKTNSRYQYSEIMYYNAARDMVLLHDQLTQQGVRTLNFLREDMLTLAVNLCNVTMLQPRGSTNMIMVNCQHTVKLLEKCLAMKEDRILRCGNNEPWGYSIMCAAYSLLEGHLGIKTPEAAKSSCAERFIHLHYRLLAGQEPPMSSGQQSLPIPCSQQQQQPGDPAKLPAMSAGVPPVEIMEREKVSSSPGAGAPAPSSSHSWMPRMLTPSAAAAAAAQSATPFAAVPSASQGSATQVEVPGTPWWLPSTTEAPPPPSNPEFNMEFLGMNVNELWADSLDFY